MTSPRKMTEDGVKRAKAEGTPSARYLALLRTRNQTTEEQWSANDLRAILDHQLGTRLDCDLPEAASDRDCIGKGTGGPHSGSCRCLTFRDLLRCAAPSSELLKLAKEFAKKSVHVECTLPPDVARYFYVLSALRARTHGIAGVSTLSNASIAREASRCLTFAWLSDEARELLRSSLAAMSFDGHLDKNEAALRPKGLSNSLMPSD
jgi:hypothetical protein